MVARGSAWLLAIALLVLAGCSSPGVDRASTSPATLVSTSVPSTEQPPTSGTAESQSAADDILVEFSRQGGIAGISDHLTVLEDGTVTVTRTRPASSGSGQLSAGQLADLQQQLATLSVAQVPKADPVQGNDFYSYRVIYREGEILAEQGSVPAALEPLIATLAGIVAAYG